MVLKKQQDALISMQGSTEGSYSQVAEKHFIPIEHAENVNFSVETKHSGYKAIDYLDYIESDGKKKVSDSYESYYQRSYPALFKTADMQVDVDKETGIVKINEYYEIENYWQDGDKHYESDFYPYDIRDTVFKPKQVKRSAPLSFAYPKNLQQNYEIQFESDGWEFDRDEFTEDNPFFSFTKKVSFANQTLKLKFDYRSKVDHIPADKIDTYLAARDRFLDEAHFGILKYRKDTQATSSSGSDTEVSETESTFSWWYVVLSAYILGTLFIIVNWRIESKSRPSFEGTHFYPISSLKFIILAIGTIGFYEMYWMYRNWKAAKVKQDLDIMPIARGIFAPIWFYPLFSTLRKDSIERFEKNKVLFPLVAAIFAITYLAISIFSNYSEDMSVVLLGLFTPLLFIPLVLYVNSLNDRTGQAFKYNSKWKLRQVIALLLYAPLIAYTLAIETPFLPSDSIRTESQILDSDLKYMYRKQVLPANEEIHYFYSGATFNIRNDGNGFTDNRVFSFWADDQDGFQSETATYEEIKNIEVEYSDDEETDTIITIMREDSSNFLLFVSQVDDGDKRFFSKLNKLWKRKRESMTE